MRILILKGKGREWGPVYRDYLGIFTHGQAEFTEVEMFDIDAVNDSVSSGMHDGYVITGSTDDAHDSAEYVFNLMERIQELYARRAKIVGICFGHQIVARALGGVTGPSDKGWGVGPRVTPLLDEAADKFIMTCARDYDQWQMAIALKHNEKARSLLTLLSDEKNDSKGHVKLFYTHQDQVLTPPTDGDLRCFVGNEHCPYAGFYTPDQKLLTFQGHPEFDTDLLLEIIELLDGKGKYHKLGYSESLDDIVQNIKENYGESSVEGPHGFSALVDNIFIGKCIVACLLP